MDDFKKVGVELYRMVLEEHAFLSVAAIANSDDMFKQFMDANLKVNEFLVEHDGDFKKASLEVEANEMLNQEV